ncbi:hypothetical protein IL306_005261 [Fusarium sp. DS 682]|nr:hypothetical protein IL306_005261 [Fusarium sp. DS 682]
MSSPCKPSSSTAVISVASTSSTEDSQPESSTAFISQTTAVTESDTFSESSTIATTSVSTSSAEAETTTAITTTVAAGPTNLLVNPGFEDSTTSPWTVINDVGTLAISSDISRPPSLQSGLFTMTSDSLILSGIKQTIDPSSIKVGTEYQFSIYTLLAAAQGCAEQIIACGAGTGYVNSANWGAEMDDGGVFSTVTCTWDQAGLDAGPSVLVQRLCYSTSFYAEDAGLMEKVA